MQKLYDETWKGQIQNFWNRGGRDFELHNEPNLTSEGLGLQWADGQEFGVEFEKMCKLILADFPEAKLWFPGMSPGVPWTNQFAFIDPAWAILKKYCTGFCLHAYTGNNTDIPTAVNEIAVAVFFNNEY